MQIKKSIKKLFSVFMTTIFISIIFQIGLFAPKYAYASSQISYTNFKSASFTAAAYGNNTYVAVGCKGATAFSSDALSWSYSVPNDSFNFNDVTFGNNKFVAVGENGVVKTSVDGVTWTSQSSGTTAGLDKIVFTGTEFYTVGYSTNNSTTPATYSGVVLKSTDGITWVPVNIGAADKAINSIAYGNSIIAITDYQGNVYYSNNNGSSWSKNANINDSINFIAFLHDRFYIGTVGAYLYYSSSAASWTNVGDPFRSVATGGCSQPFSGLYDGSKYYMFGFDVSSGAYGGIMTSTNGTAFISQNNYQNSTMIVNGCLYANGKYIECGSQGIRVSTDGDHWRYATATGKFNSVIFDGNNYVSVGDASISTGATTYSTSSDGTIYKSSDFSNWTMCDIPLVKTLKSIAYGNGRYVAVGLPNSGTSGEIVTSSDSTNWLVSSSPNSESTIGLTSVVYANNLFVAVGGNGSIITSSDGGQTWSSVHSGSNYMLNYVDYINGKFVACGTKGEVLFSSNGTDWTEKTTGDTLETFYGIAYGNYKYVLVGQKSSKAISVISSDLSTYSAAQVDSDSSYLISYKGVKYQYGSFVAFGNMPSSAASTPNEAYLSVSSDGTFWTKTDCGFAKPIYGINYLNNKFRVVGYDGLSLSADLAVNTAPTVSADSASSITATGAMLEGTVNSNNSDTTVTFEYGTTTAYGNTVTASQSPVTGSSDASVSSVISGLSPNTTYHYRIEATNAVGTSYSNDGTFTTLTVDSSVSPTTASFDKNTANQADVVVSMTLNGNTLSSITNAGTPLVAGTDYTVSGNTLTIKKGYLATLNTGTATLTLNFSAGNSQTLAVAVSDTTPSNSSISPTTAGFDKNTANQADVPVTMTLNGNTLSSITNAGTPLVSGTDYTVSGNTVTIKKGYLAALSTGAATLTFNFSAGNSQTLVVTVSDTTPSNSSISPTTAGFDKNTANQADVAVTLTLNGNTLSSITNAGTPLVSGFDYTVSGNTVTIKKGYLAALSTGTATLTLNFSAGNSQTLAVAVSDTTPSNSSISPTTASFDKNTANQVDVAVTTTLNGNTLSSITNAGTPLVSGTDYTVNGNTVTIKKGYLAALSTGTATLTFNFSAGYSQTLAVTVSDTTPSNSSISPTTASFDKNTANQADVAVTMTLNGNTLSSITNAGTPLVNGTNYTVSGNSVTIKKGYLAALSTGAVTLTFNFSAGNSQTLAVTVSDTTSYTVVFKGYDGSTIGIPQTVAYGNSAVAPAAPTREGYKFTVWDKAYNNITSNLVVTAQYSINQYVLAYTAGVNGSIAGAINQTVDWKTDGTEVTAVPNTGYHFVNWSDFVTTASRKDTNVIVNKNVTAQFAINNYNVNYNSQGGSAVNGATADYGTKITAPTAPAITGYTFGGWYKEAACQNEWDFTKDIITADTTLYAKWTINSYTVIFKNYDGSIIGTPQTVVYGSAALVPVNPVRTGYVFAGWNKAFNNVTGDLVITATYTSGNTYMLTPVVNSENTVETQASAGYLESRDNTLSVNNNVADLSIPASAIDISDITGSDYIKVTEKVVDNATTGNTMALFNSLPSGVQMVGNPLSLNIQLFDSNGKLIRDIHQFANNQKVKVVIKLTSDQIKGIDTSKLSMYYYDETNKIWIELGGSFNSDTMEFTFYTSHFTNFAIMQKVSTPNAADSTISNSVSSSASSSKKESLPKTGCIIDINVIFVIGTVLVVIGTLMYRKRKID